MADKFVKGDEMGLAAAVRKLLQYPQQGEPSAIIKFLQDAIASKDPNDAIMNMMPGGMAIQPARQALFHGSKTHPSVLRRLGVKFNPKGVTKSDAGNLGEGFYATTQKDFAGDFAEYPARDWSREIDRGVKIGPLRDKQLDRGYVMSVHSEPKNPKVIYDDREAWLNHETKGSSYNDPSPITFDEFKDEMIRENDETSFGPMSSTSQRVAKRVRKKFMDMGHDGVVMINSDGSKTVVFFNEADATEAIQFGKPKKPLP
jgi:hypothetical protein